MDNQTSGGCPWDRDEKNKKKNKERILGKNVKIRKQAQKSVKVDALPVTVHEVPMETFTRVIKSVRCQVEPEGEIISCCLKQDLMVCS